MATLKNLVDETTNIKNELVECYSNLKNILDAKGAEVTEEDRMSSLIDKVGELKVVTNIPIAGESTELYSRANEIVYDGTTEKKFDEYLHTGKSGSIRVTFEMKSYSYNRVRGYVKIERDGEIVETKSTSSSSTSYTKYVVDIDILEGDTVSLWNKNEYGSNYCYTRNLRISCDYLAE